MIDLSTSFTENGFLASKDALAGLLAKLAPSSRQQMSRRREAQLARQELCHRFPDVASRDRLDQVSPASRRQTGRASHGAPVNEIDKASAVERPSAGPLTCVGQSRIRRYQPCRCGQCARCQDNARWNQIFDEKFADPEYYGRLHFRQNSTLAGAR